MKTKKYWDDFYKKNTDSELTEGSNFSLFSLNKIKKIFPDKWNDISLLDIGCGNGRDTNFFRANGIQAYGIDLCYNDKSDYIKQGDALSIDEVYDVYYLRFFLHTIEEAQTNILIQNINKLISNNSYIFIETRSTKNITNQEKSETNFKSSIGDEHFRMLYSYKYLLKKFRNYFNIDYSLEDKGLAIFKDDDPYVIRFILSCKTQ